MAAYRRVYDSRHLQADCQEPGSAPDPTLGNRVWATSLKFTLHHIFLFVSPAAHGLGDSGGTVFSTCPRICACVRVYGRGIVRLEMCGNGL